MAGARKVPVILDVDTGIDDALALALAVLWERVELVAVTTLSGNVDVGKATRNSLTVLDWFDAEAVPVHRGASRPLARQPHDATHYHGQDGLGNAALNPSGRLPGPDRGPAAIIRLATSRPGEITLVCVGPLTNLAIALNVEPGLPDLIAGLVLMGGAFWRPGNVTPSAEFNIFADPEAAAQVFAAAPRFKRLVAVGLDVSMQTALTPEEWRAAATADLPGPRLFHRICRFGFVERGDQAFPLHDPLALAVAVDPSLVEVEPVAVAVDFEAPHQGRTRPVGPGAVQVARAVDAERFLALFRQTIGLAEQPAAG